MFAQKEEIIEYLRKVYGVYNVAHITTFGLLLAKGTIRDVCRVFGVPFSEANAISSLIPTGSGATNRISRL